MRSNRQFKGVCLAVVSALLLATTTNANHHDVFKVATTEDQVEGTLRGQRKRIRTNQFRNVAEEATNSENTTDQHHRRAQTLIEKMNQRVDKIGIDSYYNPEPMPDKPQLMQLTNRAKKAGWEVFFADADEEMDFDLRIMSMVS